MLIEQANSLLFLSGSPAFQAASAVGAAAEYGALTRFIDLICNPPRSH